MLAARNLRNWLRNPNLLASELLQYVFVALFVGAYLFVSQHSLTGQIMWLGCDGSGLCHCCQPLPCRMLPAWDVIDAEGLVHCHSVCMHRRLWRLYKMGTLISSGVPTATVLFFILAPLHPLAISTHCLTLAPCILQQPRTRLQTLDLRSMYCSSTAVCTATCTAGLMYCGSFSDDLADGVNNRVAAIWFAFTIMSFTPSYTRQATAVAALPLPWLALP